MPWRLAVEPLRWQQQGCPSMPFARWNGPREDCPSGREDVPRRLRRAYPPTGVAIATAAGLGQLAVPCQAADTSHWYLSHAPIAQQALRGTVHNLRWITQGHKFPLFPAGIEPAFPP